MNIVTTGREYFGVLVLRLCNLDWKTRERLYDLSKGKIKPIWDKEDKYMTYDFSNDNLIAYYNSEEFNKDAVDEMIEHFKDNLMPSEEPIGTISCDITNESIDFYYKEENNRLEYLRCPECGAVLDTVNMTTINVYVEYNYVIGKDFKIDFDTEQAIDEDYSESEYAPYSINCPYCYSVLPIEIIESIIDKNEELTY